MLFFAHTGITVGIACLLKQTAPRKQSHAYDEAKNAAVAEDIMGTTPSHNGYVHLISTTTSGIDFRYVLLGSLLPDIIDKPLGMVFLRDYFSNGRIVAHTLLFLLLLTVAAIYVFRRRHKTQLLTMAFATLVHLTLDQMWLDPHTLLWPAFGWQFQKEDLTSWWQTILDSLHSAPPVYVPELLGAALLLIIGLRLIRKKTVIAFITRGRLCD